jgi:hypothetical protein
MQLSQHSAVGARAAAHMSVTVARLQLDQARGLLRRGEGAGLAVAVLMAAYQQLDSSQGALTPLDEAGDDALEGGGGVAVDEAQAFADAKKQAGAPCRPVASCRGWRQVCRGAALPAGGARPRRSSRPCRRHPCPCMAYADTAAAVPRAPGGRGCHSGAGLPRPPGRRAGRGVGGLRGAAAPSQGALHGRQHPAGQATWWRPLRGGRAPQCERRGTAGRPYHAAPR